MIGCVAAVAFTCLVGAIWYSSKLPTGRLWMRRYFPGKTEDEISQIQGPAMLLSTISVGMLSLLLRFILINSLDAHSVMDGVKFGMGLSCLTLIMEIPHVLFAKRYVDAFILDQLFNFTVVTGSAVCVVYFG